MVHTRRVHPEHELTFNVRPLDEGFHTPFTKILKVGVAAPFMPDTFSTDAQAPSSALQIAKARPNTKATEAALPVILPENHPRGEQQNGDSLVTFLVWRNSIRDVIL